jgi:hypothetical protein
MKVLTFLSLFVLMVFSVSLLQSCLERDYAQASGKCDKAQKQAEQCMITNLLVCENSPLAKSYGTNIDRCTDLDGYAFILMGMCEKPEVCQPTSTSTEGEPFR